MELTYHRKGDYLFPNLTVEEEEVTIDPEVTNAASACCSKR